MTSSTEHKALISKELKVPTYKHVCRGAKKKVNLGYNNDPWNLKVERNTLIPYPEKRSTEGAISQNWEVLSSFFDIQNIAPRWLNCNYTWGHYQEEEGGWTGCMGKVSVSFSVYNIIFN